MPGVQFGQDIDMNANSITELAPGVASTDAVNLSQIVSFEGFTATIGDGVASTFNLNHALALTDKNAFLIRVGEVSSGVEYNVENTGVDLNNASVTFGFVPTASQFFVAILPVR